MKKNIFFIGTTRHTYDIALIKYKIYLLNLSFNYDKAPSIKIY